MYHIVINSCSRAFCSLFALLTVTQDLTDLEDGGVLSVSVPFPARPPPGLTVYQKTLISCQTCQHDSPSPGSAPAESPPAPMCHCDSLPSQVLLLIRLSTACPIQVDVVRMKVPFGHRRGRLTSPYLH